MSAFQSENCVSWCSSFTVSEKLLVRLKEQIRERTVCPLYFKPCASTLLFLEKEISAIITAFEGRNVCCFYELENFYFAPKGKLD